MTRFQMRFTVRPTKLKDLSLIFVVQKINASWKYLFYYPLHLLPFRREVF